MHITGQDDIPLWLSLCLGRPRPLCERSRTPKKHRSYSKSRSRSRSRSPRKSKAFDFDKRTGVWRSRSRSGSRSRDRPRRSRSRSRERRGGRDFYASFYRGRSRSRERRGGRRSRSRERRARSPTDLRIKIDKAKLREIALKNAVANMKAGRGPTVNLKPDEVAALRAGGKSIDELTEFCKKIAKKDGSFSSDESGDDMSHLYPNSDEEEKPFNHPFKIADSTNIAINIRNARQLPTHTAVERTIQNAELRLQFPVSSGTQHRCKESEWVPVTKQDASASSATCTTVAIPAPVPPPSATPAPPKETPDPKAIMPPPPPPADKPGKEATEEDKVFPDPPEEDINIGDIVSSRLSAIRKLQNNPNDVQALSNMYNINKKMSQWAASKQLPGQFTGSTGVQTLTPSELQGGHQAWVRKDTFKQAAPMQGGIGKLLLERMGWKTGEGLGKNKEGSLEPLALDVKNDRKGLSSEGEIQAKPGRGVARVGAVIRDMSGELNSKHPVSALVEICNKRRWGSPEFIVVNETGPDHKKNFLFKVMVNKTEYQPAMASNTKKNAKAQAATVALQELGMVPRD